MEVRMNTARHEPCSCLGHMQQRDAMKRQSTTTAERRSPHNCVQCGDVLDGDRLKRVARGERVLLCSDCSFDAPCTD